MVLQYEKQRLSIGLVFCSNIFPKNVLYQLIRVQQDQTCYTTVNKISYIQTVYVIVYCKQTSNMKHFHDAKANK